MWRPLLITICIVPLYLTSKTEAAKGREVGPRSFEYVPLNSLTIQSLFDNGRKDSGVKKKVSLNSRDNAESATPSSAGEVLIPFDGGQKESEIIYVKQQPPPQSTIQRKEDSMLNSDGGNGSSEKSTESWWTTLEKRKKKKKQKKKKDKTKQERRNRPASSNVSLDDKRNYLLDILNAFLDEYEAKQDNVNHGKLRTVLIRMADYIVAKDFKINQDALISVYMRTLYNPKVLSSEVRIISKSNQIPVVELVEDLMEERQIHRPKPVTVATTAIKRPFFAQQYGEIKDHDLQVGHHVVTGTVPGSQGNFKIFSIRHHQKNPANLTNISKVKYPELVQKFKESFTKTTTVSTTTTTTMSTTTTASTTTTTTTISLEDVRIADIPWQDQDVRTANIPWRDQDRPEPENKQPSLSLTELLRSKTIHPPERNYFHGFETVSFKELDQLDPATIRRRMTTSPSTTSTTTTSTMATSRWMTTSRTTRTTTTTTTTTTTMTTTPEPHEGLKSFNFLEYLARRKNQATNGGATFTNPFTTEPPELPTVLSIFSSSADYQSLPFPFVPGSHGHRHVGMMGDEEQPINR